ncbi:MAG TPA: diaminopimelate decarboxylase [Solirubrobacteraceae bacterium]|nr:diaminopimelate decarboxylase [Solirubrobacteraceae bacterium]
MPTAVQLSPAFPADSRVNERGRLEVGGCDTLELAREFGTPAFVVAEQDLRDRAREFRAAARGAGRPDAAIVFASKAFPCTAVIAVLAAEGLWCDVASAGELHIALAAGVAPERIVVHGNAKSRRELERALAERVALIVVDNEDELAVLAELAPGAEQEVLVRVTPDVSGRTHEKISTGQADSKFGMEPERARAALAQAAAIDGLRPVGIHAHIGSQLLELAPFEREVAAFAQFADLAVWDLGGGLGVRYTADQPPPPTIEAYVRALIGGAARAGFPPAGRLLIEPGRAVTANSCVTLYTVETVKQNVSRWVAVDGGMSDNMRPMLYGARYEAHVADRLGGATRCVLAGKHCESGDVIVGDAMLDAPRRGDVVVTPATGAYGYSLANNYNGVPRAPVVFCSGGDARLVVRREHLDELTARDVG